ncbi:hypothetical protein CMU19_04315 [Elizabethkingia anophelis]|nr:hypothetical protein [Elizabethkingia anophelis]
MSQLGFTFYPKDWWTSDSFFMLQPIERYIYLECLFMMYSNGGYIADSKFLIERRFEVEITDSMWDSITSLMIRDNGNLTHKSVNKRIRKAQANRENGKKGGAPKGNQNARKSTQTTKENNEENNLKTTQKTTKTTGCFDELNQVDSVNTYKSTENQPKQPTIITHNNPPLEREKEREIKEESIKENGDKSPTRSGKVFIAPTIEEVCAYFSENGYCEEIGKKAWKYYNSAGWKDSKGNKIKSWKQKMIGVWFKDDNKKPEKRVTNDWKSEKREMTQEEIDKMLAESEIKTYQSGIDFKNSI